VKYLQNVPAFYKDQGSDQPVTKKAKKVCFPLLVWVKNVNVLMP